MSTIMERLTSLLCARAAALPLSRCRITRPYLLDRSGIGTSGTAMFFAVPYLVSADAHDASRSVSLYAVPRDYHLYVRQLGEEILPVLARDFPGVRFSLFSDHSPLAEVDGAARAGLGVVGLNGLLITPDYGSFIFIAEVVTSADYETAVGRAEPVFPDAPPACIRCGACRRACPAGCLDGQTGRDMTSCLSALTQKKGALTEEEGRALSRHPLAWGCDTCQIVCPMNRAALDGRHDTPIPFFRESRLPRLTLPVLDGMTDDAFSQRAYAWRGRSVIRRGLLLHSSMEDNS